MGVETDYVYASANELDDVFNSMNPSNDFDGVYGKGSDPFTLYCLECVLNGKEISYDDANVIVDRFELIKCTDDGCKSLCTVPESIENLFRTLEKEQFEEVIAAWLQTEAAEISGWDEEIASEFLSSMRSMVTGQKNPEKKLYMWVAV